MSGDDEDCDGSDGDCDGDVDEGYTAQDTSCGVGACASHGTTACVDGEIEDSCEAGDAAADDTTCDGVDDDCDEDTDEEYVSIDTACGMGACASIGETSCVSGEVEDSCVTGTAAASDTTCNDVDEDCNGSADENYVSLSTMCGMGACADTGTTSCVGGEVQDSCVAGTAAASDTTCNDVDEDCNGTADENYAPHATACGDGVCAATGTSSCVSGMEQQNCTPGTQQAMTDTTCNGVDEDCNGSADENYAPHATACGQGVCAAAGTSSCVSGVEQQNCTPGAQQAMTDTTCNGDDEDCNGSADENYAPHATACGQGVCAATGTSSCASGIEQQNCTPDAQQAMTDTTCNGVDEDCNGSADEDFVSAGTACGVGACERTGETSCVEGEVEDSCTAGQPTVGDTSCDSADDDCDGTNDEDYIGCFDGTTLGSCVDGDVIGTFACNDTIDCTEDLCIDETGSCDFVPLSDQCDDDGYGCTHEVCVADLGCQTIRIDTGCPDASFCDGSEVCDPLRTEDAPGADALGCAEAPEQNVPCDSGVDIDGVFCTETVCVEEGSGMGHCDSEPVHGLCDDTEFCTGTEVCDPESGAEDGCVLGTDPCPEAPACAVQTCDEVDGCGAVPDATFSCGDGNPCTADACDVDADPALNPTGCISMPIIGCTGCEEDADCADEFDCTADTCVGEPGDRTCENDEFLCDCLIDDDCDDEHACTVDSCTDAGECVNTPDDAFCSTDPDAGDPDGICDGVDVCDPDTAVDTAIGCVSNALPAPSCDDGLGCTFDGCNADTGCFHILDNLGCLASDPIACDGAAYCDPQANPATNPSGCVNPAAFVVCPDDGIACTQEMCVEPSGVCVSVGDDDYCIAQPGGCGSTCQADVGCVRTCNIATCQGKLYQCGDCLDNDGDCRIDSGSDEACLGPCSNNEDGYAGEIPGQNNAPCKMDCYFDQDTGAGNDDCFWSHSCDPLSVTPGYPPSGDSKCDYDPNANIPGTQLTCASAQAMQSLRCTDETPGATPSETGTDYCGDLVPNGCDCFGCCEIPGEDRAVYLGSTDAEGVGTCTPETLGDPLLCKPCTQVEACRNTCEACEICVGRPLPAACEGCQVCPEDQQRCGSECGSPCDPGYFCLTGCCVPVPS